jgi:hypothetical protein
VNLTELDLPPMIISPTLGRPSTDIRRIDCAASARFKASGPYLKQFDIKAVDNIAPNLSAAESAEVRNKSYLCCHEIG